MVSRARRALQVLTLAAVPVVTAAVVGEPAGARALATCSTAQLRLISDDRNGAGGHLILYFRLRNTSHSTCTMFGFPGVRLVDHGRVLPLPVAWSAADFFGLTHERRVTLRPGRVASFRVVITTRQERCDLTATAIQVFAPNTAEPLIVRLDDEIGGCDVSVIPIQPGASYGHPA